MSTDVIKQGYVKFQSKNLGVWKKRWLILKSQSKEGPVRLEKYEDETAAAMSRKCRTFIMSDVENIYRLPDSEKRHAIHVTIDQYESIQFCLESEIEANSWMKMIEGEIAHAHHSKDAFPVYLMKNPKLPTYGECTLEITEESLRLLNHRDQEIVAWPLNKLRRYGVERNLFTIEAGRSCPTGEGVFVFESEEAQDIYDRIHNVAKTVAFSKKVNDMKASTDNKANEDRSASASKSSYSSRSNSKGGGSNTYQFRETETYNSNSSREKKVNYQEVQKSIEELSTCLTKVEENDYQLKNIGEGYINAGSVQGVSTNDDEDEEFYSEIPSSGIRKK